MLKQKVKIENEYKHYECFNVNSDFDLQQEILALKESIKKLQEDVDLLVKCSGYIKKTNSTSF